MSKDEKELRSLSKQLRKINQTPLVDMRKALELLRVDAVPDPATLPTRQQRRKAERERDKKGRRL